jgi:hypothetical protein
MGPVATRGAIAVLGASAVAPPRIVVLRLEASVLSIPLAVRVVGAKAGQEKTEREQEHQGVPEAQAALEAQWGRMVAREPHHSSAAAWMI